MATWKILLFAYLALGALIISATRARKEVLGVATPKERSMNPLWKVVALYAVTIVAAILFWPIFIPGWFRQRETLLDAFDQTADKSELKGRFEAMSAVSAGGCDSDEIPGATGEFGYHLSNPIPTKTTFGNTSYLARLQTQDGNKVQYERVGSFTSPISDLPVDGYRLNDSKGTEIGIIYLSPYHQRNSEKAPAGLAIQK